jgi:hypothetical protein
MTSTSPAPVDRHDDAVPTAEPLPDFLRGFAAMHDAMRGDGPLLGAAIGRCRNRADGAAIERWYRRFRAAIEHHHVREDDVLWPDLVARDPGFATELDQLATDHHALDEHLAATAEALASISGGSDSIDPTDIERGVAAAAALSDLLHDHLAREEDAAFGRIARAYTPEEFDAIEQAMVKGMSMADLAFAGPWTLDRMDTAIATELMTGLPAPMRLLLRFVFTRWYRRLAKPLATASTP